MEFLNPQIAKLAKSKKNSLVRKPVSCGIFQELPSASEEQKATAQEKMD